VVLIYFTEPDIFVGGTPFLFRVMEGHGIKTTKSAERKRSIGVLDGKLDGRKDPDNRFPAWRGWNRKRIENHRESERWQHH
jgi:hypothetical protein